MLPPCPKIGDLERALLGQNAQPFDLAPELGLCLGIEDVEAEPAHALHRGAQLADDGERGNLPKRGLRPKPLEKQFILAVLGAAQLVFRQLEALEPVE